jgi:ABC-type oligopeptide transport system substrate-binding subunit
MPLLALAFALPAGSAATGARTLGGAADVPIPSGSLRVGLLSDITTDNHISHWGCAGTDITVRIFAGTTASLYELARPAFNTIPDVALPAVPPEPHRSGDGWVVDVPLREDAVWSDGEPITAGDLAFTFDLVTQPWMFCFDFFKAAQPGSEQVGVLSVVAVDDQTVRITFNGEPGLAVWPHSIGTAPIFPEHFWAPHVEAAHAAGEAAAAAALAEIGERGGVTEDELESRAAFAYGQAAEKALLRVSSQGAPSGGPLIFAEWVPNTLVRNVANTRYFRAGEQVISGDHTYTMGPFIEEEVFIVYDSQVELMLALANGDVDYAPVPSALPPAMRVLLDRNPDITHQVENEFNGFWYVGFNLRKPPMNDPAFRHALAMMIDRDFVANELFQGGVPPAWTLLPEGNRLHFDPDAASDIAAKYRDKDRFQRLEEAVSILREAGYTWDTEPMVGRDETGIRVIESGSGIRALDGALIEELEVLSPGGDFYLWFPGYNLYITGLLEDLGFSARSNISGFGGFVDGLWPGVGEIPGFDIHLLGWILGDPALPTFHEGFFHSRNLAEVNDGSNAVGYVSPEVDALTERLNRVKTREEATEILWELERLVDRDLPYIVLHRLYISEAYNSAKVSYPFTGSLGGLSWYPGLVQVSDSTE